MAQPQPQIADFESMTENKSKNNKIQLLREAFENLAKLPDGEWEYASSRFPERTFQKGEFLIRAGALAHDFFFVIKGLVRFFYATESGKEFNKYFCMENMFGGSYYSTQFNTPCNFFCQALEKTETFIIPNAFLQELYRRHPAWERIGRIHAEHYAIKKELREREFLLDLAETRYNRFLKEFPGLINRIPQYHIASYLGITEVALSRIRKKSKN